MVMFCIAYITDDAILDQKSKVNVTKSRKNSIIQITICARVETNIVSIIRRFRLTLNRTHAVYQ